MAQRATSLGRKPSLFGFVVVVVFFVSSCLLVIEKSVSPLNKGIFCLFVCVSLYFCLALCWPPPVSISLFLPVSCPFLSSFLLVSHVSFWVLLFVIVLFVFSFKMFFCFCFSACCSVWHHYITYCFGFASCFLVVVFLFLFFALIFVYCLIFLSIENISQKYGNSKNPKMKMQKKTDILTRAVSTFVFTNSVFFSFLCFFTFCIVC